MIKTLRDVYHLAQGNYFTWAGVQLATLADVDVNRQKQVSSICTPYYTIFVDVEKFKDAVKLYGTVAIDELALAYAELSSTDDPEERVIVHGEQVTDTQTGDRTTTVDGDQRMRTDHSGDQITTGTEYMGAPASSSNTRYTSPHTGTKITSEDDTHTDAPYTDITKVESGDDKTTVHSSTDREYKAQGTYAALQRQKAYNESVYSILRNVIVGAINEGAI